MRRPTTFITSIDRELPIPVQETIPLIMSSYPSKGSVSTICEEQHHGDEWICKYYTEDLGHVGTITVKGIEGRPLRSRVVCVPSEKVTREEGAASLAQELSPNNIAFSNQERHTLAVTQRMDWMERKRPQFWAAFLDELWERLLAHPVLNNDVSHDSKTSKVSKRSKARMQDSTKEKLNLLREIRRESITKSARGKRGTVRVYKTYACDRAGISPKTAKKHASELWNKWNDPNYDLE